MDSRWYRQENPPPAAPAPLTPDEMWQELADQLVAAPDRWFRFDPPEGGTDPRAELARHAAAKRDNRDNAQVEYKTVAGKHYVRLALDHGPDPETIR
jgi:hypothetical protein